MRSTNHCVYVSLARRKPMFSGINSIWTSLQPFPFSLSDESGWVKMIISGLPTTNEGVVNVKLYWILCFGKHKKNHHTLPNSSRFSDKVNRMEIGNNFSRIVKGATHIINSWSDCPILPRFCIANCLENLFSSLFILMENLTNRPFGKKLMKKIESNRNWVFQA